MEDLLFADNGELSNDVIGENEDPNRLVDLLDYYYNEEIDSEYESDS
jgi:hypothetical protein